MVLGTPPGVLYKSQTVTAWGSLHSEIQEPIRTLDLKILSLFK